MRYRKKIIVFLVAVALVSGGFVAVSVQSATEGPKSEADSVFANDPTGQIRNSSPQGRELFFKMMLSVLLVIVLGVAAIYASRKLLPRITNSPGKQIRILETAHLGPRKAVHLIEIGPLDARCSSIFRPLGTAKDEILDTRRDLSDDSQESRIKNQGSRMLLIGSTNEGITMLAELDTRCSSILRSRATAKDEILDTRQESGIENQESRM